MSFTVSCDTEVLNDNILTIFVTCFDKMSISTLECLHGTIRFDAPLLTLSMTVLYWLMTLPVGSII